MWSFECAGRSCVSLEVQRLRANGHPEPQSATTVNHSAPGSSPAGNLFCMLFPASLFSHFLLSRCCLDNKRLKMAEYKTVPEEAAAGFVAARQNHRYSGSVCTFHSFRPYYMVFINRWGLLRRHEWRLLSTEVDNTVLYSPQKKLNLRVTTPQIKVQQGRNTSSQTIRRL